MKTKPRLTLLALVLLAVAPAAHAQVAVTTSLFVGSPYVWRGQVLSSGWVIQPTVSAGYNGFSATVFGNIDPEGTWLPSGSGNLHLQEADLTLGYGTTLSNVALGAGYTLYNFPTPGEDGMQYFRTQELYASAGLTTGPVQPSVFFAYDFDGDDDSENPLKGFYGEAKLGVPVDLGGQAYGFAAALGLDGGYFQRYATLADPAGPDESTSLSHLALTGTTTLDAGPVALSPLIGFQANLDDTYKDLFGSTFFYGGLTIGF